MVLPLFVRCTWTWNYRPLPICSSKWRTNWRVGYRYTDGYRCWTFAWLWVFQQVADRCIETGFYLAAAAITGGKTTPHTNPYIMESVLTSLRKWVQKSHVGLDDWLICKASALKRWVLNIGFIQSFNRHAGTDQWPSNAIGRGFCYHFEKPFSKNRFSVYVPELSRKGATFRSMAMSAVVTGGKPLAAPVMATDLRALVFTLFLLRWLQRVKHWLIVYTILIVATSVWNENCKV